MVALARAAEPGSLAFVIVDVPCKAASCLVAGFSRGRCTPAAR